MYKGFTKVQMAKPERSQFDLDHEKKLSTRMGRLVPIFISETMPNDTFKVSSEIMLRLAPMIAPIYHQVNVFVHYFFVPNRLLWKDWETFITGGRLGNETPPVPPYLSITTIGGQAQSRFTKGKLPDFLGIPPMTDAVANTYTGVNISALPFACYHKVYEDYYKDRNYEADSTILPLSSGNNSTNASALMNLENRKWEHDYFTSALPWTQRGTTVLMPLQGTGSVTYLSTSLIKRSDGGTPNANTLAGNSPAGGQFFVDKTGTTSSPGTTGRIENIQSVDITNSNVSINDLRRAVRLQEWLERNAVAGSRYTESIMAHFARKSSDARLQRAEYLGGGKVPIQISEVVNTAYSTDAVGNNVPPANMSGHGLSFGKSNYFKYNCEEHGFVIGIMSIMPKSNYSQGMPRMFLQRNTFLDYPWPSFAHLGEQEVYRYELYNSPANATPTNTPVFGYQSRYADWKFIPSTIHGDFRDTLEFWHLARKFSTSPVLGETFVTFEDELQNRIFNVSNVDTCWAYIYNKVKVVRSLPYFGTPILA